MTWFWNALAGPTTDPGCSYLREFKKAFLSMEIQPEQLVRLDLSSRPEWVQKLATETKAWAVNLLARGVFDRADYHDSVLWLFWHLGVEAEDIPGFSPIKFPGPDIQARWMSKAIGFPKILAAARSTP